MDPTKIPRVKICCIASIEEAWLAIRQGASALGLVSDMPSGPGVIGEALIAEIAARVPPGVSSFLLTSKQDTRSIIEQQKKTRANTIQICDRLVHGTYEELREELPGVSLVQVIHITGKEAVEEAVLAADHVDALLLDSGNQFLKVKELGGTGRSHDWGISREIREIVHIPVFLAGGLNPSNVRDAINAVGPFGVDVCTGVRTEGHLDRIKLSQFFEALL